MPFLGLGSKYRSGFDREKIMNVPSKVFHDLSYWPFIHQAQSHKALTETRSLLRTSEEPQKIKRLLELQGEQLGHGLLQTVKKTKIGLTNAEEWTADLNNIGLDFCVKATRYEFLQSIFSLIERIEASMQECLSLARCKDSDVELVILTGGSSELPVINSMVQSKFPNAKISKDDKFGSVGRGLAYNASNLYKRSAGCVG